MSDMKNDAVFTAGVKYEIFIGIKDKDSCLEVISVDEFKEILSEICTEKKISFSMLTQHGGYAHEKGYTTETSLRVILIGPDEEEVSALAEKLKKRINTDAVLITKTDIECCFI